MTRQIQSTQHRHGEVVHQGINAHQRESFPNSLSDQQAIKRVFVRHWQLVKTAVLPSRPPGCRGAVAARVAESSRVASRAPTWPRSSADRRNNWRCSDGLMAVIATVAKTRSQPRWVESRSPGVPQKGMHGWLKNPQEVR